MPSKGTKSAAKKGEKHHDSVMLTLLHDVYEHVSETQHEFTNKFTNFTKHTEKCFN